MIKKDDKYTKKISPPQYLPKNKKPNICDLIDIRKYIDLMAEISRSNVSDEEKEFLKFAATRHIVFNYSKIADYYAHSDKELQELMEKSALVIIDFNDAIANGYVEMSKEIYNIIKENKDCS